MISIQANNPNAINFRDHNLSTKNSFELIEVNSSIKHEIILSASEKIEKYGAALLRNSGIRSSADFSNIVDALITTPMSYQAGHNAREDLGHGVLTVGTEPPFIDILAHNEMSYLDSFPEKIFFGCLSCPTKKGSTNIADNSKVTDDILKTDLGQKLRSHGVKYIRNFSDRTKGSEFPAMRHWQDVFGVETPQEMVELAKIQKLELEFGPHGELTTAYHRPAFEYSQTEGKNLLFASFVAHGSLYDSWPPFDLLENRKRPSHLVLGNGEEFEQIDLDTYKDIFNRHERQIEWQPGMIMALDNIRWTHSRPSFDLKPGEKREIMVKIGNPLNRIGPSDEISFNQAF